jgi:hypothetical protein
LINRSLVLGTIDRPSVRDLVLDFVVAQHYGDALRESHRAVMEAFRTARLADLHGRRKFDNMHARAWGWSRWLADTGGGTRAERAFYVLRVGK